MTPFINSLNHISIKNNSLLCIGLDPHLDKIPQHLKDVQTSLFHFNKAIIDVTSDPEVFKKIRAIVGNMWLLVPGVGAQGGTIEDVMENGKNGNGTGVIISVSRSIIYAGNQKDFANAVRVSAQELRNEINIYR